MQRTKGPFVDFSIGHMSLWELQEENERIVREFEEGGVEDVSKSADVRYAIVASSTAEDGFKTTDSGGTLPTRSPYAAKAKMGRGSPFAPKFREFVETGGLGQHKNAVVVNIR